MAKQDSLEMFQGLSGTLQEVYPYLDDNGLDHIADGLLQHLWDEGRDSSHTRCESTSRGAFKTAHRFHYDTGDERVEPCDTDEELWDRVYMPPAARNATTQEDMAFFRKTMPATDGFFYYTQMDLAAKNVVVEKGEFVGFVSQERAGYFPAWWQGWAVWQLWRQSADSASHLEDLMLPTVELLLRRHSEATVNRKWAKTLLAELGFREDVEYPSWFNKPPEAVIRASPYVWFHHIYNCRLGNSSERCKEWQKEMLALRARGGTDPSNFERDWITSGNLTLHTNQCTEARCCKSCRMWQRKLGARRRRELATRGEEVQEDTQPPEDDSEEDAAVW